MSLNIFCLADTITPFMLITGMRLIIGNIVIALVESLILRCFFKVRYISLVGWMFGANYCSAFFGAIFLVGLSPIIAVAFRPMIFHLKMFLLFMFVLAFVFSFVLELPFVLYAVSSNPYSRQRTVVACGAAQITSYAMLFPLYWFTTLGVTQYNAEIVPTKSLSFVKHRAASVVFLSPDSLSLMKARFDGSAIQTMLPVPSGNPRDLTIRKAENADRWDLYSTDYWDEADPAQMPHRAKVLRQGIVGRFPDYIGTRDLNIYIDWRRLAERDWHIDSDNDPNSSHFGLKARNEGLQESFEIKLISPFLSWVERCPNILPGDQVVFEISGEIVVLDLNTRKLGFVAYGHSPIVISLGTDDSNQDEKSTAALEH